MRSMPKRKPAAAPDERELVRRSLARDDQAFRIIMSRYNRRLYRIARGIVRNDSDAEDIVQETYVKAFTHLARFRGESSLSTWLSRIAINEALGHLRRKRRMKEVDGVEDRRSQAEIIPFPQMTTNEDPEKTMAQRQILRLVEQATDNLPENFRLVFVTRVIEGMSVEEAAEILCIPPETVKTRLHRARKLVREQLDKQVGPVLMDAFPFAGSRCERVSEAVLRRLGFLA